MASVLAVDDYEPTLYAHVRALKGFGYQVFEARDGRTALDVANREQPDVLVLDVHLPDLHGFEVCQQLKDDPRTAHIQVIHVSATGRGDRFRRESAAVGAFAYLQEPIPAAELRRMVALAVKASRSLTAASAALNKRTAEARMTAEREQRRSRRLARRKPRQATG